MKPPNSRLFAVIPAAGHSRRMGRHKLLLPLKGRTVIERLLATLDRIEIIDRMVVVRQDDDTLREAAEAAGGTVVQPPVDPPDMRQSVEFGLQQIEDRHAPQPQEAWILVPADHPVLDPTVLEELIDEWNRRSCSILVPTYQGRRGHPTFFRWHLVDEIRNRLPPESGLNRLLSEHASEVCELPLDNPAVITDLDTPEDYAALLND